MANNSGRVMIGGKAMNFYGSNRLTMDTDYLVYEPGKELFYQEEKGDIINAAAHGFLKDVWAVEKENQIVSPQGLLELKAFAFINHCQTGAFRKSYDDEYDIKFIAREFDLTDVPLIKKHMHPGEYAEIKKLLDEVSKQKSREINGHP